MGETLEMTVSRLRGMQAEMLEMNQELQNKAAVYRAELKKHFGITDGEQMNVLDMIEAMRRIKELN